MKKEFVVGFFLFLGLIAFGFSIFVIKDIKLKKGYILYLYFDDVGNLSERAWVRMRGVTIGRVEKIDIEDSKAKVKIWINNKIKIYKTAKAKISSTGVLGVKYIEILQGEPTKEYFVNGDGFYNTESIVSIDDAISEGIYTLRKFGSILAGVVEEKSLAKRLDYILDNIENITHKLNSSLEEQQIKKTIKNVEVATENLNKFLENTKDDVKNTVLTLKNISEKINILSENINSTQTIAGQVFTDKESGKKVAQTISSLALVAEKADKTLNRINMFTTYWDYRFRYDTKNNFSKNDIGIEVYSKPTKFYYLSVNNISSDEENITEKSNTISIGIGGNFYDRLTLYGGLIKSYGGVGMKLFPLGYKTKLLEFNIEAYNFSKSRSSPQVDLGLNMRLTKWLFLGAKYEDVALSEIFNTSLNIRFEDEDIAYLLGLIGLTR